MKRRPEITDEEISRFMNFDAVLNEHASHKNKANHWLLRSVALIGLGSAVLVIYMMSVSESAIQTNPASPDNTPVTVDSVTTSKAPAPISPTQPTIEEKIVESKPAQSKSENEPSLEKERTNEAAKTEVAEPTYTEAEPATGFPDLYEYFSRELRYPAEAMKDSIQGVVSVMFVINTQGKAEQIKIQNSLGELFDREAHRLIENMPLWKPASLNGKPVSAKLSMPITFRISTKKPE